MNGYEFTHDIDRPCLHSKPPSARPISALSRNDLVWALEILLVRHVPVSRQYKAKPRFPRGVQQVAVPEPVPPLLSGCPNGVAFQGTCASVQGSPDQKRILISGCVRRFFVEAAYRKLDDGFNLSAVEPVKPLHHSRTFQNPSAANLPWDALSLRTLRPIETCPTSRLLLY